MPRSAHTTYGPGVLDVWYSLAGGLLATLAAVTPMHTVVFVLRRWRRLSWRELGIAPDADGTDAELAALEALVDRRKHAARWFRPLEVGALIAIYPAILVNAFARRDDASMWRVWACCVPVYSFVAWLLLFR